jgi:hypothetical protein
VTAYYPVQENARSTQGWPDLHQKLAVGRVAKIVKGINLAYHDLMTIIWNRPIESEQLAPRQFA